MTKFALAMVENKKKQTCSLEKNESEQATVIFKKYPAEFLRAECKILQFS